MRVKKSVLPFDILGGKQKKESTVETERSPCRTVIPDTSTKPSVSGINLIRIIKEHGQVEIDEIDARIAALRQEIENLEQKRNMIAKLVETVNGPTSTIASVLIR